GPYPGGNHQYMVKIKEKITLTIPNPHHGDIGEGLLAKLLKQARVDKATWEKL
ncbi:MAG: type II toxin-antitoxin system HicA family toxin, partial [Ktedonobacteraceae bacterium]